MKSFVLFLALAAGIATAAPAHASQCVTTCHGGDAYSSHRACYTYCY